MVGAVKPPEGMDLVHDSMVPIEPKVKNNPIETDYRDYPSPVHRGWRFLDRVCKADNGEHAREITKHEN
jgi:hypothetical protein